METRAIGVALDRDAFDGRGQRNACGAERGQDAEEQAGEKRDADGEAEDALVHREVEKYLGLFGGDETDKQRAAPFREQNSQQRAAGGKQNAFSEDLANQSRAGGAASEKKARDVGASDEQNEGNDNHEHFKRLLILATQTG